jgi:hypothetical protein
VGALAFLQGLGLGFELVELTLFIALLLQQTGLGIPLDVQRGLGRGNLADQGLNIRLGLVQLGGQVLGLTLCRRRFGLQFRQGLALGLDLLLQLVQPFLQTNVFATLGFQFRQQGFNVAAQLGLLLYPGLGGGGNFPGSPAAFFQGLLYLALWPGSAAPVRRPCAGRWSAVVWPGSAAGPAGQFQYRAFGPPPGWRLRGRPAAGAGAGAVLLPG